MALFSVALFLAIQIACLKIKESQVRFSQDYFSQLLFFHIKSPLYENLPMHF